MPETPEISVIIPSKDRCSRMQATLAGALGQEDVALEVIVVDDGSTDGTYERLSGLDDPRLRVVRNEQSQGASRARNRGIAQARAEWLAFLDDDDLWAPRKLREQLDAAYAASATVAYSSALIVTDGLDPIEVNRAPKADLVRKDILRRMAIPGGCSNLIAAASLVHATGGFDENIHATADWEFWTRLILDGVPVDCQDVHVAYVTHAGNMSVVDADRFSREFDYLARKFQEPRKAEGVEIDGVKFTRWLAGGYRRGGRPRDAIRTYMQGAVRYRNAGNVVRAIGTGLGEAAMRFGKGPRDAEPFDEPEWLALYRPGGDLRGSQEASRAD